MTGQVAVQTLRRGLGWTHANIARHTFVSTRTISRIEKGLVEPRTINQVALVRLAVANKPKPLRTAFPRHVIEPSRMDHYLNRPTGGWSHWSLRKRGQFRRWRLYYRRVLADQAAGRCIIEYRTRVK